MQDEQQQAPEFSAEEQAGNDAYLEGWREAGVDAIAAVREEGIETHLDAVRRLERLFLATPGEPPTSPVVVRKEERSDRWSVGDDGSGLWCAVGPWRQTEREAANDAADAEAPRSPRGRCLAWSFDGVRSHLSNRVDPVLTVELATKWHELFVVEVDGTVRALEHGFAALSELPERCEGLTGSPYIDHVPNPAWLRALAEIEGWWLDELAEEIAIGRWRLELGLS